MSETEPVSEVKWKNPPPKTLRYDWPKIADKLRKKPGKWALIFEQDRTSLATSIRINGISALSPDKGFVVRTANNKRESKGEPRLCDLYLMYDPEKDTTLKAGD